jgi:hypothetical protein
MSISLSIKPRSLIPRLSRWLKNTKKLPNMDTNPGKKTPNQQYFKDKAYVAVATSVPTIKRFQFSIEYNHPKRTMAHKHTNLPKM